MRPKDSSLDSFGAGAHDLEAAGHAQTLAIAAAEGTEVSGAALATSNEDAYKSEWGHTTPSPSASQEGAPDTKEVAEAHKFNEQTNYVSRRKIITIFLACSTVDLVALMDQTTLAVALSIIGSDLGAGSQISWISNAYFLTSTSFQLLYGRLSDITGRKLCLLIGLAIFFIGSLAASLAQSVLQLSIFRAFTGIGGGGLMTIAQVIVSDVVSLRERGKYQGILGAVVAIANGIGPIIGGALASKASWRDIFRINLPLSAFCAVCVIFFMPLKKVEGHWKEKLVAIDFFGAFLMLAGSTLVVLGLTWAGGEYPWVSAHVLVPLILGAFVSAAFLLWQWNGAKLPLMPLYIFKSRMVCGACITMSINGWLFLVQTYYIPTFYQLAYGYGAVKAGALFLPLTVVQTFSSTLSGLIVTWRGRYRESILAGWAIWAIGLGLFSTLDETSSVGKQVGYALLTGFGVGQTLQPSLVAIQGAVERKNMAVVTATRNFVRNLGGSIGLAIAGTIINNTTRNALIPLGWTSSQIRSALDNPSSIFSSSSSRSSDSELHLLRQAYAHGFRNVFILLASLAAFAFSVALFMMPQVEVDRKDDEALRERARREAEEKQAVRQQASESAQVPGCSIRK